MSDLTREMLQALDKELRIVFELYLTPDRKGLRNMLFYHMGWQGEKSGFEAQGKRIRPLLVMLCTAALGGDWQQALPAAAGVEILHNFTLIHDDVEDESEIRRGRSTLWKLWGTAQAINAGDALFALVPLALARLNSQINPTMKLEAAHALFEATLDITHGQQLDIFYEDERHMSLDDYWQMVGGKTASLLAASTELGAVVAGVNQTRRDGIRRFGWKLGLAFQALDDLLGIWGDESELGKSVTSDLVSGKKTLPVVYCLEKKAEFKNRWLAGPIAIQEVPQIAELLEKEGAREYTQTTADRLTNEALSALSEVVEENEAAKVLHQLSFDLLRRNR